LVIVGLGVFFVTIYSALRAIPKQGWRLALRWIGFGLVGFAGSLCAYDVLVFEPLSPVILAFVAAASMAVLNLVRRKRHATVG
jgi:drug/metabolite transporter (DMT)-like permease